MCPHLGLFASFAVCKLKRSLYGFNPLFLASTLIYYSSKQQLTMLFSMLMTPSGTTSITQIKQQL